MIDQPKILKRRGSIKASGDRHGWNSWDHYQEIHDRRLAEHPFVDPSRPNTLEWHCYTENQRGCLFLGGEVYCRNRIVLEVRKWFEIRLVGREQPQIRAFKYVYAAKIPGRHLILKYDNGHDETPEEYHHHVYDIDTGEEIFF